MKNPKISVIVPIYNAERFLNKCIQSIINQTYNTLEIILVNDGSTDNSLGICYRYKNADRRITVLNEQNKGVSFARNKALNIASGEYIGFVDSDDFISKFMYENMIRAIIENGADVVECGYQTCDSNYKNFKRYELAESIIDGEYQCSYTYLSKRNTTNHNVNKLYKSSLFYNLRYPNLKYSEDHWINARVFYKCNRKVTLKECYYYYVTNEQSAVQKEFDYSERRDAIKAEEDLYDFYSTRFFTLCPFIALSICINVLRYYYRVDLKSDFNKKCYKQELFDTFKKFYPKIDKKTVQKIKFKPMHLSMIAYNINPKLFLILRSIYFKIKQKQTKTFE